MRHQLEQRLTQSLTPVLLQYAATTCAIKTTTTTTTTQNIKGPVLAPNTWIHRHHSTSSNRQQTIPRNLVITPKAGATSRESTRGHQSVATISQYDLPSLSKESVFRAKDRVGYVKMDNGNRKQSHLCVLIHG